MNISKNYPFYSQMGKMGPVKDRKYTALTEAEDIKKRWQEYTEALCTKKKKKKKTIS